MKPKVIGIIGLIVLIAVTVISTVCITIDECSVYAPSENNVRYYDVDEEGNRYAYFCSAKNEGIVKLSNKNKLITSVTDSGLELFSGQTVIDLVCSKHNLYIVTKSASGANVYTYDEELVLKNRREVLAGEGTTFGKVTAEGEIVYIPEISPDGSNVSVYKAVGKEDGLIKVYSEDAPENISFINGFYSNERFESLMSDGSRTSGYSGIEDLEKVVPDNAGIIGVSMGFATVARNVIIMALIIFVLVFFFRAVILKRSYVWLRIYGFMIIVSMCMVAVIFITEDRISSVRLEDRVSQMDFVLDSFGDKISDYDGSVGTQKASDAFNELKGCAQSCSIVQDVVVVSENNNRARVALSAQYPYGEWLADEWGEQIDEIIKKAQLRNSIVSGEVMVGGIDYVVVLKPIKGNNQNRLYITALVKSADLAAEEESTMLAFVIAMSIVWIIGLAIIVYVNLSGSAELKHISDTLVKISRCEQNDVVRPSKGCRDYEKLWSCAVEIAKNLGRNNYSKNQMYDSLVRFAPTNIEKLLGKESVSDIRQGERENITGNIALIKMSKPFVKNRDEYLDIMNHNIDVISKYRDQFDGVVLADSKTLCNSAVLFPEDKDDAVVFGVKAAQAFGTNSDITRQKSIVFMHNTSYMFGITGSEDQNFACISSVEIEAIDQYIDDLSDIGLRLVVTEPVIRQYRGEITTRYIGFLELKDSGTNIRIYEVLDACDIKERKKKKDTAESFAKALDLYYRNDFYLARNIFTEVIKACPEDLVARWYLFKCEGMLDNMDTEEFSYGFLTK